MNYWYSFCVRRAPNRAAEGPLRRRALVNLAQHDVDQIVNPSTSAIQRLIFCATVIQSRLSSPLQMQTPNKVRGPADKENRF